MKKLIFFFVWLSIQFSLNAQSPAADTVVVELAGSSKIVLTVHDREDLELLRHYDFQGLFDDILDELEESDTSFFEINEEDEFEADMDDEDEEEEYEEEDEDENEDDDFDYDEEEEDEEDDFDYYDEDDEDEEDEEFRDRFSGSFDLGIGNYVSSTGFPDEEGAQYAVKPWGSWYVGLSSVYHQRVNDNFKFEWGLGFSQYNFKFQDERTLVTETADGIEFSRDQRDAIFIKSKLSVSYLNLSVVPVFEFGPYRDHDWKIYRRNFRIGAGLYGAYRLHSFTKQKYQLADEIEKEKTADNYFLNNIRYGVRLQVGVRDVDFFFNYDLNHLFAEDRGPSLNAYSFGIMF